VCLRVSACVCLQPIGPHVYPVKVRMGELAVYTYSYIRRLNEVTH